MAIFDQSSVIGYSMTNVQNSKPEEVKLYKVTDQNNLASLYINMICWNKFQRKYSIDR